VAQRLFEGRMLVVTPRDSKLHRLNEVGTFIWQRLETSPSVGELCSLVEHTFDVADRQALPAQIGAFVGTMVERGLVRIARSGVTE
jgi:hypothetical protein